MNTVTIVNRDDLAALLKHAGDTNHALLISPITCTALHGALQPPIWGGLPISTIHDVFMAWMVSGEVPALLAHRLAEAAEAAGLMP